MFEECVRGGKKLAGERLVIPYEKRGGDDAREALDTLAFFEIEQPFAPLVRRRRDETIADREGIAAVGERRAQRAIERGLGKPLINDLLEVGHGANRPF